MKERPILFSGAMVRAILDGSKTQTRRIAKGVAAVHVKTGEALASIDSAGPRIACPYGQPGDRLWVRETFAHIYRDNTAPETRCEDDVVFKTDGFAADEYVYGSWKPSIHMPRWASRITLEITGVRIERLQDITAADAISEGIEAQRSAFGTAWRCYTSSHPGGSWYPEGKAIAPIHSYRSLWENLHGIGAWAANPLVWVVEFRRIAE